MTIMATPAARRAAAERRIDLSSIRPTGKTGYIQLSDVYAAKRYTPLAKAVADYYKVDILGLTPNGRSIVKKDVLAFLDSNAASGKIPLTAMRRVIAQRMESSARNVPQFTLFGEFDMQMVKTHFAGLKNELWQTENLKMTFSDVLIKLSAEALKSHPLVNASFKGDHILLNGDINIGLAVALDSGLIVPNIKHVDRMTLAEVAKARIAMVTKARAGKLKPDDYSGGTFTISNLGGYPVSQFNPLINEPESGIMGVGRMADMPVVIDGNIGIRPILGLSVTFDHRTVDGAEGGKFLATIKTLIDDPSWLV